MRKLQQRKILESLQMLEEAHSELRKKLAPEALTNLLSDCQALAIQIGEFVEEIAARDTKTVSLLEEYCEIAYRASLKSDGTNYVKKLKKHLIVVIDTVREELKPDKLEVVFFPYNASMWDSLESVYLAAKDDPQCDPYVVPIPYYEVLHDGSLGEMHCDIDKYPDHIPITDWRTYDIKSRHPDIAFIHYPFDDKANNASIHQNFYSEQLIKYCEKLIYIPYYVITGEDVDDYNGYLPGVLNAHKVILESERIRQAYMRHYKKYDKELGLHGQYGKAEDKFVALGSPKYDKIINSKREDFELPDQWRRLIFRPDGSRKKIVLYNVHMFTWIKKGEAYFKKLCSVFDMFRNRDDVVLLWRPHPNTELNFRLKRPQLYNAYLSLVNDYKSKGFGIYDDTPDLHRAITLSDMYYGDLSSVAVLYKITGKPVLVQNVEITCAESQWQEYLHSDAVFNGNRVVSAEDFKLEYPQWHDYWLSVRNDALAHDHVILADYEYGVSACLNAVYKTNTEDASARYLFSFEGDDMNAWLYHPPCRIGTTLLFTPNRARRWAFYDILNASWRYEDIPDEFCPEKEGDCAVGGWQMFENALIFAPGIAGALARYDLNTGKITYHSEWHSKLPDKAGNQNWNYISAAQIWRKSMLLVSQRNNFVYEIDPATMLLKNIFEVKSSGYGFRTAYIVPNSDTVYFIRFRGLAENNWTETIVKWNIVTGDTKELTGLPVKPIENSTQNLLGSFLFFKGRLYAIPLEGDSILKIDLQTDAAVRLELKPEFDFFERKSELYKKYFNRQALPYSIFNGNKMSFTFSFPYDYSLAEVDFETGKLCNRRKWSVDGLEEYRSAQRIGVFAGWIVENEFFSLNGALDILVSGQEMPRADTTEDINQQESGLLQNGRSGIAIYNYLKGLIGV